MVNKRYFQVRFAVGALVAILLWLLPVPIAHAQQTRITYDELERIVRIIDPQGNIATFTYDALGNIISITRTTTQELGPPTITSVTPSSFTISPGEQVALVVEGTALLGAAVTTDNPACQ